MRIRHQHVAWVAAALAALFGTACLVFVAIGSQPPRSIAYVVIAAAYSLVGAIVASRRPDNPIGWIFVLVGLGWAVELAGDAYAGYALFHGHPDLPAAIGFAWLSSWSWLPLISVPLTALSLLFPTGRPLSPRWWLAGIAAGIGLVVTTTFGEATVDTLSLVGDTRQVPNPYAFSAPLVVVGLGLGLVLLITGILACVASLVIRFRRSNGSERVQLKWIVASLVFMAVAAVVGATLWAVTELAFVITGLGLTAPPLATGFAILRYRLYEIDRIVNRTVVYALVSAILAGFYFGIVLALQQVFSGFTRGNDLAIAGSTLAVAALFRPARARIQAFVDRRFYRRRYDAEQTLAAFSARLRDEIDLQALETELGHVVDETMQPAHISLWIRDQGGRS